jgi:hypothetical protein
MTEPALQQEAERVRTGAIWLIGISLTASTAVLSVIAWALVVAPPAARPAAPSPLRRVVFDVAGAGAAENAAGLQRLERTEWVDRQARVVRIPIERAIEAVVADPRLIGKAPPAGAPATGDRIGEVRR